MERTSVSMPGNIKAVNYKTLDFSPLSEFLVATTSKLTFGRISQEPPVRTQHDRQLGLGNVEMVDQCTRRVVGIGIESLIRFAVSS